MFGHPSTAAFPYPQVRDKDREEMSGRCQIGWAEGTGHQAETGNKGKDKGAHLGCVCGGAPSPQILK